MTLTVSELRALSSNCCPVPGCDKRPEGYKSRQALKYHLASHAAAELASLGADAEAAAAKADAMRAGPFHCGEPGCAFGPGVGRRTLKTLKTALQHARTHAAEAGGGTTFACPGCDKTFALRYRLTEHQKSCGTKAFKCACGAAFAHKGSLHNHCVNAAAKGEAHASLHRPADAAPAAPLGEEADALQATL